MFHFSFTSEGNSTGMVRQRERKHIHGTIQLAEKMVFTCLQRIRRYSILLQVQKTKKQKMRGRGVGVVYELSIFAETKQTSSLPVPFA